MQIKHTPISFASGYALGLEHTQRTGSLTWSSVRGGCIILLWGAEALTLVNCSA